MPGAQAMPPQAAPQAAPQGEPQGRPVSELVTDTNSNLMQLMDIVSKSGAASPEDKQQLAGIIQSYQGWVDALTSGPQPQAPGPVGPASMEAGVANVRPVL